MLYVDNMKTPFRRMLMSHLIADTSQELAQAERTLGLPEGSIQYQGTWKEHLDVSQSKRAEALKMGATSLTGKQLAIMLIERREAEKAQLDQYPKHSTNKK